MKVLTLWRPWPWAIFNLPEDCAKDIENRTWHPPKDAIGKFIAIHAGRSEDDWEAAYFIRDRGGQMPPPNTRQGIVGVARLVESVSASTSPWFVGPVGWRLGERIAFPSPVECKGMQGLWTAPPEVEARVREQLRSVGR